MSWSLPWRHLISAVATLLPSTSTQHPPEMGHFNQTKSWAGAGLEMADCLQTMGLSSVSCYTFPLCFVISTDWLFVSRVPDLLCHLISVISTLYLHYIRLVSV